MDEIEKIYRGIDKIEEMQDKMFSTISMQEIIAFLRDLNLYSSFVAKEIGMRIWRVNNDG